MDLPKAELHVHVEGTLEPELAFELAERNRVELPYSSVEELRAAYVFDDLQSFLDVYYAVCAVLVEEQDFYDLTSAYLGRAAGQGVRHVELFFDPQTHTCGGVPFAAAVGGVYRVLEDERGDAGRHLRPHPLLPAPPERAGGVRHPGPDPPAPPPGARWASTPPRSGTLPPNSRRCSTPPAARAWAVVAHAGEEGPPSYIGEALDLLGARRIDHGVRCLEERHCRAAGRRAGPPHRLPAVQRAAGRLPEHRGTPPARTVRRGLLVTVNSDDPAYFGGYVADNFAAVAPRLRRGRVRGPRPQLLPRGVPLRRRAVRPPGAPRAVRRRPAALMGGPGAAPLRARCGPPGRATGRGGRGNTGGGDAVVAGAGRRTSACRTTDARGGTSMAEPLYTATATAWGGGTAG